MSREAQGPISAAQLAAALREARVAKGLDLEQAARQAMLSEDQAAGLESGDHHTFYSPDYARRAARRYAESLGLGHLVADLEIPAAAPAPQPGTTAAPAQREVIPERLAVPVTPRRMPGINALLLLGGAVAVTAIAWFASPERAREQPAATAAVTAAPQDRPALAAATTPVAQPTQDEAAAPAMPVAGTEPVPAPETAGPPPALAPAPVESPPIAAPEAAPEPAAAAAGTAAQTPPRRSPRRFYVLALRGTPLRIRDGTGRALYDGVVGPGFSQSFEGEPPFSVEADSPDPLELYYLGRRVRLQEMGAERAAARFGDLPTPAR